MYTNRRSVPSANLRCWTAFSRAPTVPFRQKGTQRQKRETLARMESTHSVLPGCIFDFCGNPEILVGEKGILRLKLNCEDTCCFLNAGEKFKASVGIHLTLFSSGKRSLSRPLPVSVGEYTKEELFCTRHYYERVRLRFVSSQEGNVRAATLV